MIVDISALLAILLVEPEQSIFIDALVGAEERSIAAGTWVELSAVLIRSRRTCLRAKVQALMVESPIDIAPMSVQQAQIAYEAYRTYGLGVGHPAGLNFGDCFAYALSKESGRPLLFKGDGFRHTDVEAAV